MYDFPSPKDLLQMTMSNNQTLQEIKDFLQSHARNSDIPRFSYRPLKILDLRELESIVSYLKRKGYTVETIKLGQHTQLNISWDWAA